MFAAWVVLDTVRGQTSLGQMTMYIVPASSRGAITASLSAIAGLYDDICFLRDLYEYLLTPVAEWPAYQGASRRRSALRARGLPPRRWEGPALTDINLHFLAPGKAPALGGENGSSKTSLIKLLTRLYPARGAYSADGSDCKTGMNRLRQLG